jgi:ABC-type phosphate transport system auxiliary subunit
MMTPGNENANLAAQRQMQEDLAREHYQKMLLRQEEEQKRIQEQRVQQQVAAMQQPQMRDSLQMRDTVQAQVGFNIAPPSNQFQN